MLQRYPAQLFAQAFMNVLSEGGLCLSQGRDKIVDEISVQGFAGNLKSTLCSLADTF